MEHDIARPVGPQAQHANARSRHGLGHRLADPARLQLGGLRAQDARDGQDIDAVGRPEQLLVVLGQADVGPLGRALGQEREDAAAIVVDDHDRRR